MFSYYDSLFRSPADIAGRISTNKKYLRKSLKYKADEGFADILSKLKIKLFISREYEHLLLCLSSEKGKIKQTYHPLPHPSGLAVKEGFLYAASTRNPNYIVQFGSVKDFLTRKEDKIIHKPGALVPLRTKFYPGAYYFHDLAFIGNDLYANSVGQNGVVKIDFDKAAPDPVLWRPPLKGQAAEKLLKSNYLQLNSIAAGQDLQNSFFSASTETPGKLRPGNPDFPVDGRGVIFSGSGDIVARGLTRPHSARLHRGKLWINNSGYGSFGFIENQKFEPLIKLPGWTRGLFLKDNIAFVGTSRILERFENYAPGLRKSEAFTAVYAIDIEKKEIAGKIKFPYGNQIFGIEAMDDELSNGFIFNNIQNNTMRIKSYFYKYKI